MLAASGATNATSLPSFAMYIGSIPRISAAPATTGATGTEASSTTIETPAARASSLSTEATPPRVASRMQRSRSPAAPSSASTAGHSEHVSERTSASSSNSPRASMIAVPCSPTLPESRILSPGAIADGASVAAWVATADAGRVDVHAVGVATLDDLRVAGRDLDPGGGGRVRNRLDLPGSVSADSPSSRISDSDSATARAPLTARSLTVPLTASSPIDPPGNAAA